MMSIWAWGANTCGQLGLGFASEQVSSPHKLDLDAFRPDSLKELKRSVNPLNVLISGGGTETCFVFSPCEKGKQGAVICVGLPVHPQIGIKGSDLQNPGKAVPGFAAKELKHVETSLCHVSSGWDFHIAIDGEGSVSSWGNNAFGQLGHESKGRDALFAIQGFKAVTVAAGLRHSAAVTVDGRLFLWGGNNKGLLGVGSDSKIVKEPKEACLSGSAKQTFVSVKCGKGFTIALDTNGEFWGCGTNKFDQLGNIKGDLTTFTKLNIGPFESRVKHFQCGWNHTLVLLESGDIFSWGRNNFFQLGNCNQVHHVPRKVEGIVEPVTAIICGSEHSLALGASGTLYSWGWNEHDNCGVPSNYSSQALTSVASQTNHPQTLDCVRGPTAVSFPPEAGKVVYIGCGYGNSFAVTEF